MSLHKPLQARDVLRLAWPIVLAQAATATTGIVDTAVMGREGAETGLAAVAVASVTFSFLYWGFGFLRMATTAQSAQAVGSNNRPEARAVLQRALGLAGGLGIVLLLAFPVLSAAALAGFQADAAVESEALSYMVWRIGGAPAALAGFAVTGWLLGMGRTRALLGFQISLNLINAVLDVAFVRAGMGAAGIGLGTALAEWFALGIGLWLVRDGLAWRPESFERSKLVAMLAVNRDIMVRTLALLTAFAWFVNSGARVGAESLAGNQVLLQFIAVSAFLLDSFAFVAEKEVAEAVGAHDRARLGRAMGLTSGLALAAGLCISGALFLVGEPVVVWFVADEGAREAALRQLHLCALVPTLGVPAWLLDGFFLGATRGRALRNAAVAATIAYVLLDSWARPYAGNTGVWGAFLAMYALRACFLLPGVPGLLASAGKEAPGA